METIDRPPVPVEVLIPEARQHRRRRYLRSGEVVITCGLVVGALILSLLLLLPGAPGRGSAPADSKAAAPVTGRVGLVYFRPVLCFAPAYAAPHGAAATAAASRTEAVPPCSAASVLSASSLDVQRTGHSPGGFSMHAPPGPDPQDATYPSSSVHETGYASSTVLLPGIRDACGGPTLRCVLGPAELTGRAIGHASVRHTQIGVWEVDYVMAGPGNEALLDKVAETHFHEMIGIDLGGMVYSTPIIQPAQVSFTSFAGHGVVSGRLNQSQAIYLAKEMNLHRG